MIFHFVSIFRNETQTEKFEKNFFLSSTKEINFHRNWITLIKYENMNSTKRFINHKKVVVFCENSVLEGECHRNDIVLLNCDMCQLTN